MTDQITTEQVEEIAGALAGNRKIEAIKIYRQATGKGLKEANDFIQALIPRLKEQDPQRFAHLAPAGSGCASVVFLCLGLTAIGVIGTVIPVVGSLLDGFGG